MIALLWIALLLALPAGTAAQNPEKSFIASFSVKASNGYRISVDGRRQSVDITVSEGRPRPGRRVTTTYSTPGTASTEGINANFGDFGEISVRFEPTGAIETKPLRLPKDCHAPDKVTRQLGTFVGTIRFWGEAGYTSFEAEEASGYIGPATDFLCITVGTGEERHTRTPRSPYLRVSRHDLGFAALIPGPHKPVQFAAASIEKRERISITRWISVKSPRSDFGLDPDLDAATVSPPPPFSGTATYRRKQGRGNFSWSGSLSASFPGAPEVPLTGPSFISASLVDLS